MSLKPSSLPRSNGRVRSTSSALAATNAKIQPRPSMNSANAIAATPSSQPRLRDDPATTMRPPTSAACRHLGRLSAPTRRARPPPDGELSEASGARSDAFRRRAHVPCSSVDCRRVRRLRPVNASRKAGMKTTVSRAIGVALFGLVAGLMLASVASGASTSEPRDGSTIRLAAAYAPAGFVQVDPPTLVIGGGSSPPDVNPPEAKSFHVKAKRVKKLLNRVVKLRQEAGSNREGCPSRKVVQSRSRSPRLREARHPRSYGHTQGKEVRTCDRADDEAGTPVRSQGKHEACPEHRETRTGHSQALLTAWLPDSRLEAKNSSRREVHGRARRDRGAATADGESTDLSGELSTSAIGAVTVGDEETRFGG